MLPSRRLCVAHSRVSRVKISCIGHVQHLILHDEIHDGRNTCNSDSSLLPIKSRYKNHYVYSGINRTYCTVFPRNNVCLQLPDERRLNSTQLFHTTTYTSNNVDSNATTSAATTAANNTLTERIIDHIPESITSITSCATIWGATAFLLTNFHTHLHIPYWACISLTNVCIRGGMLPIAIRGAKTSVKFGNIAPEVQYLISSFTRDFQKLKASSPEGGGGGVVRMGDRVGFVDTTKEQLRLVKTTVSTLQGVMKLAKVNLFDIFKSPMLQIPFFWYFALDLRKVINGVDPQLAQQLVDSSFLWITDCWACILQILSCASRNY